MTIYKKWQDMTEEEREAVKKEREDKLNATQELLIKGIRSVIDSGQWKKFLAFSDKFWHYSFRNMMLVWIQRPNSTQIASVKTWNELGRYVLKGEKGMEILVPIFKKVSEINDAGVSVERKLLVNFKVGHVFDISQTDGKPIEETSGVKYLVGNDVELLSHLINYAKEVLHVQVEEEAGLNDVSGYISYSGPNSVPDKIVLNASRTPTMMAKTMAHEITHGILHTKTEYTEHTSRDIKELEAESSAFLVMNAFGIDSGEYSFLYLAGWSNGEEGIKAIQDSGTHIHKAACSIIEWIQEKYELVQEKELDANLSYG